MDLRPFIETIQEQLALAAEAGGEEARALTERLMVPLDSAMRLALQDVLAAAAEEITVELAPGSVELRLRGRDPEFVVTPSPTDTSAEDLADRDAGHGESPALARAAGLRASGDLDDGSMLRINLRLPDHLKARIEQAADSEGLSVNAWLVRSAAAALERTDPERRRARRGTQGAQHYTGWVR